MAMHRVFTTFDGIFGVSETRDFGCDDPEAAPCGDHVSIQRTVQVPTELNAPLQFCEVIVHG